MNKPVNFKPFVWISLLAGLCIAVGSAIGQSPLAWATYPDDSAGIQFGNGVWEQVAIPAAEDGTLTYTVDPNATLLLEFDGTGLEILHSAGPEGGEFEARLYNPQYTQLDVQRGQGYAATYEYSHSLMFSDLPQGRYTVTLINGGGAFWLEAIRVQGELNIPASPNYDLAARAQNLTAQDRTAEFLSLINDFRCQFGETGIKQVLANPHLTAAAATHSLQMATYGFANHYNAVDGSTPYHRMANAGYSDASLMAENIATGQADLTATFEQWKNSAQGHREVMLDPRVTEIGLAYVFRVDSPFTHHWTLDLGSRAAVTAPDCPPRSEDQIALAAPQINGNQDKGLVTLAWSLEDHEAGYYEVVYDTDPYGSFSQTFTTSEANAAIQAIVQNNPSQSYYFRVRAYLPQQAAFTPFSQIMEVKSPDGIPAGYNPYDYRADYDIELPVIAIQNELFLPYYSLDIPRPPDYNAPNVPFFSNQGITATVWATEGVHFRASPSLYGEVIKVLLPNSTYPVLSRTIDGFWIELSVEGQTGWVHQHWLSFNGSRYNIRVNGGFSGPVAFANTGVYKLCMAGGFNQNVLVHTTLPIHYRIPPDPTGTEFWYPTAMERPILAGQHVTVLGQSPNGRWIKIWQESRGILGWAFKDCFTDAHTYRKLGEMPVLTQ